MVTIWPIPEEAREALENGEHLVLDVDGMGDEIALAFEEYVDDVSNACTWEHED